MVEPRSELNTDILPLFSLIIEIPVQTSPEIRSSSNSAGNLASLSTLAIRLTREAEHGASTPSALLLSLLFPLPPSSSSAASLCPAYLLH